MKAFIISKDADFSALLSLALEDYEVYTGETLPENMQGVSLVVLDLDSASVPENYFGKTVTFSRKKYEGKDFLLRPFSLSDFRRACEKEHVRNLNIIGEKRIIVDNRSYTLPMREFSIFKLLFDMDGKFVTFDEISEKCFEGHADSGLISVTIHNLRKRIEEDRRIIFFKKGKGYFIGGKSDG